jgi:NHL repeat
LKPSLEPRGFAVQPETDRWRFFRPLILLLALPLIALGQLDYATPYTISTLAGEPFLAGTNDGTGSAARFDDPVGAAVDGAGNLYVGDSANDIIRRVTPAGVVTTIAGKARISGTNDGTGSAARFNDPFGVAVDGATNLYVADRNNHTIRKLAPIGTNWMVTTLVGTAGVSGTNDGTGVLRYLIVLLG